MSNLRPINEIEKEMIENSLSNLISISLPHFKNYQLCVIFKNQDSKFDYPSIYLVQKELIDISNLILDKTKIISAGLYFGFIKKGHFFFSIEGAEFLYKSGFIHKNSYLMVNKKGEKSILYGNNPLKGFVSKIPSNLKVNDILLVFNNLNELIALAQSQIDFNEFNNRNSDGVIASHLADKGHYLRKKQ